MALRCGEHPHSATLSRWAAEDPGAMRALLSDPVLQLYLREAMADVFEHVETREHPRGQTGTR